MGTPVRGLYYGPPFVIGGNNFAAANPNGLLFSNVAADYALNADFALNRLVRAQTRRAREPREERAPRGREARAGRRRGEMAGRVARSRAWWSGKRTRVTGHGRCER